ncbi:MAG: hypothetical protein LQ346_007775 [Caloplaca aetnensis]|nr:MAG: hypothetical protein LQ346_007775 [Caloplaca aetnensis]
MADPIATGLVGVQIIMTVVTLGFTTGNSLLRFAGLFGMLYISYFQVPYIARVKNPMARGFLANAPFVLVILYIDKLLLNKWTFAANGPTSAVGGLRPVKEGQSKKDACRRVGDKSIFRRLRFGLNNTLQARFPATNWPVKNIPTFSRSRPDSIPDRTSYLRGRIIRWIAYVLILDLAGLFNNNSSNNAILFAPANIPLLSRLANVSKGEAIERVILVMAFWVFQYIGIQVVYGFFAILGIASGLWPIEAWPPMFGFIGDCYSIRQFWG